jgi:DNA topoisomerase III
MKIAIIAEKPAVAREIAGIVGATDKQDGFLKGNGYEVTWAFGHLIGLAMPSEYGISGFSAEQLPVLPNPFILEVRQIKATHGYKTDSGALKQLKIIKKVFDDCDKIIVATDAGREGELIFRYIYNYLNCRKPFERLWISSLTDKAIREGLLNLTSGSKYDSLYMAAKARSEADWLVGINASQALSIAVGSGTYSLGRVQTPTLGMICSRYLENQHFLSSKYWQLRLQTEKDEKSFSASALDKFDSLETGQSTLLSLQKQTQLIVQSVESKEIQQESPLLYDLTTLQKDGNSKYGFSADKTLTIAQKLYEAKLITYPRTGSRYISEDVFETIPELIQSLKLNPRFGAYVVNLLHEKSHLNQHCVDAKKVTDHHALLITGNSPTKLSDDENLIYELIAGRMLEAFSDKYIKAVTSIILDCDKVLFGVKAAVIRQAGWRDVFNVSDEDENVNLPTVEKGKILPLQGIDLQKKQTKPKPLHTEATLLSFMENAGKELENDEERLAMKELGIGTPATRAAIIETLFTREYIRREKKSLVPTEKGLSVYAIVKDMQIANVQMTGSWENALFKIETGDVGVEAFNSQIEIHATQITNELLDTTVTIVEKDTCKCPKCKTGRMIFFDKVVKCSNPDCSVLIFRNKSKKQLNEKQIRELIQNGKTQLIKGFKSMNGKPFDATLVFDEQYNVVFEFAQKKSAIAK